MKNTYFLVFIFISSFIFAQEEEKETKHIVTAAFGYTFIPKGTSHNSESKDGVFVPSVGFDYFYKIKPKWEIGIMTDFEFGEYIIFSENLNRKNAIVVVAVGSFAITKSLNIFAGGGMEFEQEHSIPIIRLGTEYSFKIKKGWVIAPGIFFDIKEGYDTWSFSLAFGKEF